MNKRPRPTQDIRDTNGGKYRSSKHDNEEKEDVQAIECCAVELQKSHAGRKIWLVKMPDYVAKEWMSVCRGQYQPAEQQHTMSSGKQHQSSMEESEGPEGEEGEDDGVPVDDEDGLGSRVGAVLGTLVINQNTGGQKQQGKSEGQRQQGKDGVTVKIRLTHQATQHLPQEYAMMTSRGGPPMVAFAERRDEMVRSVEGVVQHRLDVDPRSLKRGGMEGKMGMDTAYRKLARERFQAVDAGKSTRKIQIMTDSKIVDIRKPIGVESLEGKQRSKAVLDKRIASPREELLPILFKMFQKQTHWTFSQLQKETEQPTQHLKSVLSEIAVQNKVGPYKDLWELNKESQIHSQAD